MKARWSIRYRHRWVRLLVAFAAALAVQRTRSAIGWEDVDRMVFEWLLDEPIGAESLLPAPLAALVLFGLPLALAAIRLERPWAMLFSAASLAVFYFALAGLALVLGGRFLPVSLPLAALFLSGSVLETMAWSEERTRRRELERLERFRQQFADMLVHDLKNRISALTLSLRLLQRDLPDADPRQRELLGTLRVTVDRLLLQVKALLDIRRLEEGKVGLECRAVPLSPLVAEAAEEYEALRDVVDVGLRVIDPPAAGTAAFADPDLCARMLANLLWNAVQHAPPSSDIEIRLLPPDAGRVGFSVTNHGDPIPADLRARLFEPFLSGEAEHPALKTGGSGLGLAFCKLAAEAHGGGIRVESPVPGRDDGVRVTVWLPAARPPPRRDPGE